MACSSSWVKLRITDMKQRPMPDSAELVLQRGKFRSAMDFQQTRRRGMDTSAQET